MPAFAKRMEGISGSVIREIFKLMADPEIISFGGGSPAKESFPLETIEQITQEILEENGPAILQYGTTEGYQPLRESYLEWIAHKGIAANLEEVITLTGSTQGIDLAAKISVDPGDTILVESPTFLGALQTFHTYQANCVPVEMDDDGVILEDLEEKIRRYHPKLFYCIPTFQNPTGKTLATERRARIAQLAEQYDVLVLEDDPYCDLRFYGEPLPPIKTFDKVGNVILLNSFSKTISPGLRVGTVIARPDIIRKMTVAKQSSDTHTSNLTQAIVDRYLRKGLLPKHIESIIPMYKERLDAMLDCIEREFPSGFSFTRPQGGLFVWGELPGDVDMPRLLERATKEYKVAFIPGQYFYVSPETMGQNTMRFNFSGSSVEQIQAGMARLGELLRSI